MTHFDISVGSFAVVHNNFHSMCRRAVLGLGGTHGAIVDSVKALDPSRPIREADIGWTRSPTRRELLRIKVEPEVDLC
jgi:hypothetical protein